MLTLTIVKYFQVFTDVKAVGTGKKTKALQTYRLVLDSNPGPLA